MSTAVPLAPAPADCAVRAAAIEDELRALSDPVKRDFLPRFFKTGPGQYGEGDRFLGVVVPHVRRVAKAHRDEPQGVVGQLLQSPWHECRLCALLMLVERYARADSDTRAAIYAFYLSHTGGINNWDLVDLSAPYIVGRHLLDRPRADLYRLADSLVLWEQRIAVVATLMLIRHGQYADTLALAERLLHHPHDLMHKAVGWTLREVGKRDKPQLVAFLARHAAHMPRTALRYALERLPEDERRAFMKMGRGRG